MPRKSKYPLDWPRSSRTQRGNPSPLRPKVIGDLLSVGEQKTEARAAFNAALSADPQDLQSQYALIELDAAAGQFDSARKRLDRLLTGHPEDMMTRLYVADFGRKATQVPGRNRPISPSARRKSD